MCRINWFVTKIQFSEGQRVFSTNIAENANMKRGKRAINSVDYKNKLSLKLQTI